MFFVCNCFNFFFLTVLILSMSFQKKNVFVTRCFFCLFVCNYLLCCCLVQFTLQQEMFHVMWFSWLNKGVIINCAPCAKGVFPLKEVSPDFHQNPRFSKRSRITSLKSLFSSFAWLLLHLSSSSSSSLTLLWRTNRLINLLHISFPFLNLVGPRTANSSNELRGSGSLLCRRSETLARLVSPQLLGCQRSCGPLLRSVYWMWGRPHTHTHVLAVRWGRDFTKKFNSMLRCWLEANVCVAPWNM